MSNQKRIGFVLVVFLVVHLCASTPNASSSVAQSLTTFSVAQEDMEYTQHFPISIARSEDFAGLGFDGTGTLEDPYIIEQLNITVTSGNCISVTNVPDYFVIRDCFLKSSSGFYSCIDLARVNQTHIERCYLEGGRYGILNYNTFSNRIVDCIIYDANYGIGLSYSSMVEIANCSIFRNDLGIQMDGSDGCNITSNKIYRNRDAGLDVALGSNENWFSGNMIGWNRGINNEYNAADYGQDNVWIGNQWSDYIPPGLYRLEGWAVSNDTAPTMLYDPVAPRLEPHDDIFFAAGTPGMEIRWNVSDSFPLYYEVAYDGEVIIQKTWAQPTIVFSLEGLGPGERSFTLTVFDGMYRAAIDSVVAIVFDIIFSNLGSPLLALASLTSFVSVITALILFKTLQKGRVRS